MYHRWNILHESYNEYSQTILTDRPENIEETLGPNKRFWRFIKQKKSDSKEINSLKPNGTTYTKPNDKANTNILNNQFQSAFTNLVPLKLKHLAELLLPRSIMSPVMPDIFINTCGVTKQLTKLNLGKAAGPDGLTSRILKELHIEGAPILTDIFNTSLHEGKVPDDLGHAHTSLQKRTRI